MKQRQSRKIVSAIGLLGLVLAGFPDLVVATADEDEYSSQRETVKKYFANCRGAVAKDPTCDKIRKDAINILKESLLTLGSTADRAYLPDIIRIFKSEEVELRMAAADAIGMIGPQDQDVDAIVPLTNDPVPDVRAAVSNMIGRGKGNAISLLGQRVMTHHTGHTPEKPPDAAKYSMPVAPSSSYLFDSSDPSVGRLSYVSKSMNEVSSFYKGKAKKGPFPLQEFKDKYRYQFQDEDEAMRLVQEAKGKELEGTKPPDPTNVQAFTEYMQKVASVGASQGARASLDFYQPNLFGSPTVYVLEERQVGKRTYPTRYVVLYQEQAFKLPGYRLSWMTISDDLIKTAQATSLQEEKQELANKAENEAVKQKQAELDALTKKKDAAEKKQFKKGQSDLEKELGF
jgi:hypothetical protein